MRRWVLSTPERTDKDGKEKTYWHTIATCNQNDRGSIHLRLPPGVMLDGSAEYYLFPKDRDREPGDEGV